MKGANSMKYFRFRSSRGRASRYVNRKRIEEAFPRKIVTSSCKTLRLTVVAVVSAAPFLNIQRSDI